MSVVSHSQMKVMRQIISFSVAFLLEKVASSFLCQIDCNTELNMPIFNMVLAKEVDII